MATDGTNKEAESGATNTPAAFRCLAFWRLVGLYFFTRLPWLFMVPMVEAPDEFSHYWVITFLVEHMRLPELNEILAGGASGVYGSLPQLGYIPHVIAGVIGHTITPTVDLSLTDRFGSLADGLVLLWCSWEFGHKLFRSDKVLSLALPVMIIFHPQLVLLHSYANSDSTTASLAALSMLLVCRMMETGLKTKYSLILGLMLGWIVLTKYPGVSVYPACATGLICAAWLNRQSLLTFITQSLLTAIVTAASCVWWFVRSAQILNGDFMGTKTMFHTWAVTYNKSLNPDVSAWAIMKQKSWWRMTTFSYWGMFGYMTRYLWRPFYIVYMVLMGIAAGGGIKALVTAQAQKKFAALAENFKNAPALSAQERKARYGQASIWLVLAACFLSNLALMIYASTKNLGGAQGRYLFPSEIPIIALILGGLYLTGPKSRKPLILFMVAFNIIVYFASCWMLYNTAGYTPHWLKTY
ncbi:MAG: hypothetical protein JSS83_11585 [Cyanobacteria bacterium SZAS LIN-3]|nr:hypothetical protein [Cyanobacteria bacterium SZAS LIN-3]